MGDQKAALQDGRAQDSSLNLQPTTLVPSLIEGLRVVQGLRVVLVFLYRYSMKN